MKVHSDPLFHVAMCSGKKKSDQSLTHFCCCFQSMCFIKISQYISKINRKILFFKSVISRNSIVVNNDLKASIEDNTISGLQMTFDTPLRFSDMRFSFWGQNII